MSEHNEPWEVKSDCNLIHNASGDWIAQFFDNGRIGESCIDNTARAVLCVNACAGMSVEEVQQLHLINRADVLDLLDEVDTLKSDHLHKKTCLDEAVGLLRSARSLMMQPVDQANRIFWSNKITDFLIKHKEAK